MTLRPGSQEILKKGRALKNERIGALRPTCGCHRCFHALARREHIGKIHATFSSPISRPSPTSGISIPTLVPPNPPPILPVLKRTIMSLVNADLRAGDPEVRPAFGRCVLSLNSDMAVLEDQFAGKVLMVTNVYYTTFFL